MKNRDGKIRRKDILFPKESYDIKAACIAVHNVLGCGFLEKVYEKSLAYELRERDFKVQQQAALQVFYKRILVGDYVVDLLVNEKFIVEIKAAELPLGFLVNFGKEYFNFERIVFTSFH